MERDGDYFNPVSDSFNFNSHAHVERDLIFWNKYTVEEISTHTLTWSVTSATRGDYHDMDISTHTLTWSVTTTQ